MTPDLKTPRPLLTRYTAAMVVSQHIDWLNDPQVVQYSEQRHKVHTIQSQHNFLNEFPVDSHIWLIKIDDSGNYYHIGTITAYIDTPNKVANMGIMIGNRRIWKQGYGSEAWNRVMEYLFDEGMNKIECGFYQSNAGMYRLCAKSEMTYEGERASHFLVDGKPEAMIMCGRVAE